MYEWHGEQLGVGRPILMTCRTHLCARHVAHMRSHATHINKSYHTYKWVILHIQIPHVTQISKACHTHTETSHVQHINESRHTYERVMLHRIRGQSGSRVMRMNRPFFWPISFEKEPYIYTTPGLFFKRALQVARGCWGWLRPFFPTCLLYKSPANC